MQTIYKITNLINNKVYIGQTTQYPNKRFKQHLSYGYYLTKAIKKYGKENFEFKIVIQGDFNKLFTDELEKHYIHLYNSNNSLSGYNLLSGGRGTLGEMNATIVYQYSSDGKYIKKWNSISDAERKLNIVGVGQSCIRKYKANNFYFRYTKENNIIPPKHKTAKIVEVTNIINGDILLFNSARECIRELKLHVGIFKGIGNNKVFKNKYTIKYLN